jgi:hypothetical protein
MGEEAVIFPQGKGLLLPVIAMLESDFVIVLEIRRASKVVPS